MCSTKDSSPRERPKRAVTTKPAPVVWVPTKPRRRPKPRTRKKKPKYLSLKLELISSQKVMQEIVEEEDEPPLIAWMSKKKKRKRDDQLSLFLLHPEEEDDGVVVEEEEDEEEEEDRRGNGIINCGHQEQLHVNEDQHHVALLFETATDGTSSALDGLLDSSSAAAATTTSEERDPLSPSLSCVYSYGLPDYKGSLSRQGCGGTDHGLLRSAIRCKEREASVEERWVSYDEVVEAGAPLKSERYQEEEDASSNCVTGTSRSSITEDDNNSNGDNAWAKVQQRVGLKLDKYQDILDAWSDKPPFCLPPGEDPQIVPDLHHLVPMDILGSAEDLWRVPDPKQDEKRKEKDQSWKTEQREASVLRYKEKRQSRLFAKRIRYEVRKVNAEKRPRLKGRFVKRNKGAQDNADDDSLQFGSGHEEHGS